jgi:HNH endonuclease
MLRLPIMGGLFGAGRFELVTKPVIYKGLHGVRFMVIEPSAGRVLSIANTKAEALSLARKQLTDEIGLGEPQWRQDSLWPSAELPVREAANEPLPVSRRRREVYAKSNGICWYCRRPLKLASAWHVEHQQPKALGGSGELANLVASCVPCNLAKRDRTAIEYATKMLGGIVVGGE